MENSNDKKSRSRGENWTQEEKDLFLEIMRQSASIIENKLTDTNTNKQKNLEWLKIQKKLQELTGKPRDMIQLKGFWRRSKVAAKKSVSGHRRAVQATGGGQRPPSPPPDDLRIMELCPTDFIIEENIYDSDAVFQLGTGKDVEKEECNNTIYDIEEVNENIGNADVSFVNEIVTVADVHSSEVVMSSYGAESKETKPKLSTTKNLGKKNNQKNEPSKYALIEANLEFKKEAMRLMREEYDLKIKYQKEEIAHQQLRHKLEIEMLLVETEKRKLEIEILKRTLQ